MAPKLFRFTLLILATLFIFSCQKEFEIDGMTPPPPSGPATFIWEGAPGVCATAIVGGNYAAGTALDSSNRVTIVVNVSTPGTYSVTTDTANGIRFSGSGSFSGTGPQSLVLYGSGTPIAAVAAIFSAGANACSFTINTGAGNPSSDFLRAKLDGVQKEFNDLASAEWNADTLSIGGRVVGTVFEVFAIDIIGTTSLVTGVYQEEGAVPGATVFSEAAYTTDSGDIWYVDANAPTPRTNPFKVTITNISPTRVEGTFEGGLWNSGGGTTQLTVTEGAFSLPIQ